MLNGSMGAIIVADEQDRIDLFDSAAERMFGYRSAEMIGAAAGRLISEAPEQARRLAQRVDEPGQAARGGVEVRARRASGETFPAWLSIGQARDAGRCRFVAVFRDLSQLRAEADRLHALKARLDGLDSLYLAGQIGSHIAHEINQPLSAIATYAQAARHIVDGRGPDVEALRGVCVKIDEQARRAGRLIRKHRKSIPEPEPQMTPLDVDRLVDELARLIEVEAACGSVCLELEHGSNVPRVLGDALQLQLAVMDLVRNSMDAMQDGRCEDRRLRIRTAFEPPTDVRISVADCGPGVLPLLADRAFEAFVTTRRQRLGLGLFRAGAITAAHGGTLAREPPSHAGECFTITLPAYEEEAVR